MRKLIVLLAGLALVAVAQPSDATHSLDNVIANVNGGVLLDVDGDGDPNNEPCTVENEPGTGDDEIGDAAAFTDVQIAGMFVAGDSGLAAHVGQVDVGDLQVCVVTDASLPAVGPIPAIPTAGHGELGSASFSTVGTAVDPLSGQAVCLTGTLFGGTFTNTAVVSSQAFIDVEYQIRPASPGCTATPIGESAVVTLQADVLVAPTGEATAGEVPNAVSAQVHSVH